MSDSNLDNEDFFTPNSGKRAPRTFPMAFRIIAGVTTGLFIGGAIWGGVQVAYGMSAADTSYVAPITLVQAQNTYFSDNGMYTADLSKLKDGEGQPISFPAGTSAKVIGLCDDGWVAKINGLPGVKQNYVSATDDGQSYQGSNLSNLKLPSCVNVASLRKQGVVLQQSDNAVKITGLSVKRSQKVGDVIAGVHEGIRVGWGAASSCRAKTAPQYQVTIQLQAQDADIKKWQDDFSLRTVEMSSKMIKQVSANTYGVQIDGISNGSTYAVAVRGSCTAELDGAVPVSKTYTQPLPGARLRVLKDTYAYNASDGVFPLVSASSSPYVSYDIQYKRSYSEGWTTLERNYVSGGPLRKYGYYPSYGDQFRARAETFDGKQVGEWGPATTLEYRGYN